MDDAQDEQEPEDQVGPTLHFLYDAGHEAAGYYSLALITARGLWAIGMILVDIRSTLRSIEREERRR